MTNPYENPTARQARIARANELANEARRKLGVDPKPPLEDAKEDRDGI